MVTIAVVLMLSGVSLAAPNCPEKAMEKQPACAAAMSSSGLVPMPFSKREENEYCVLDNTPLSELIVPLPSIIPPLHTA